MTVMNDICGYYTTETGQTSSEEFTTSNELLEKTWLNQLDITELLLRAIRTARETPGLTLTKKECDRLWGMVEVLTARTKQLAELLNEKRGREHGKLV